MNILICGGAGYVGSHVVKYLSARGYSCVVLDNLSSGHARFVKGSLLLRRNILNKKALFRVFRDYPVDVVMHLCSLSIVSDSIKNPAQYYENNVIGTHNLLCAMLNYGVSRIVFSSSAAIFGEPQTAFISETHPKQPLSPYGRTKLIIEQMLEDYSNAYELNSVSLRYFNAAGADPEGNIGENHYPETHLIPNVLMRLASSNNSLDFQVFGSNYSTKDGTCIRDFVHVNDIASAHLLAMEYLVMNSGAHSFNIGNNKGYSVLEIIRACEKVTGWRLPYKFLPRRLGDAPVLVADNRKAKHELGWEPMYTSIEEIIATAWKWHRHMYR